MGKLKSLDNTVQEKKLRVTLDMFWRTFFANWQYLRKKWKCNSKLIRKFG